MECQFGLPKHRNEAHRVGPRKGCEVQSKKVVESPRRESMEAAQEALGARMVQLVRR